MAFGILPQVYERLFDDTCHPVPAYNFPSICRTAALKAQQIQPKYYPAVKCLDFQKPSLRISEYESGRIITAVLPGYAKGDIRLKVYQGVLTLSVSPSGSWLCHRRTLPPLSQSFLLGRDIDIRRIRAKYQEGTLLVVLPFQQRQRYCLVPNPQFGMQTNQIIHQAFVVKEISPSLHLERSSTAAAMPHPSSFLPRPPTNVKPYFSSAAANRHLVVARDQSLAGNHRMIFGNSISAESQESRTKERSGYAAPNGAVESSLQQYGGSNLPCNSASQPHSKKPTLISTPRIIPVSSPVSPRNVASSSRSPLELTQHFESSPEPTSVDSSVSSPRSDGAMSMQEQLTLSTVPVLKFVGDASPENSNSKLGNSPLRSKNQGQEDLGQAGEDDGIIGDDDEDEDGSIKACDF